MERGGLWTTNFLRERLKRSFKAAFASPLVMISILISSSSIVSIIQHYSAITPGTIGAFILEGYRNAFHGLFDAITQIFKFALPILAKDAITLWLALSGFAVRFLSGTPVGRTTSVYLSTDDAVDYNVSNQTRLNQWFFMKSMSSMWVSWFSRPAAWVYLAVLWPKYLRVIFNWPYPFLTKSPGEIDRTEAPVRIRVLNADKKTDTDLVAMEFEERARRFSGIHFFKTLLRCDNMPEEAMQYSLLFDSRMVIIFHFSALALAVGFWLFF